jgi:hypothetical protein
VHRRKKTQNLQPQCNPLQYQAYIICSKTVHFYPPKIASFALLDVGVHVIPLPMSRHLILWLPLHAKFDHVLAMDFEGRICQFHHCFYFHSAQRIFAIYIWDEADHNLIGLSNKACFPSPPGHCCKGKQTNSTRFLRQYPPSPNLIPFSSSSCLHTEMS